jgi:hypothetical protein
MFELTEPIATATFSVVPNEALHRWNGQNGALAAVVAAARPGLCTPRQCRVELPELQRQALSLTEIWPIAR